MDLSREKPSKKVIDLRKVNKNVTVAYKNIAPSTGALSKAIKDAAPKRKKGK
jgi:hypothetical protein